MTKKFNLYDKVRIKTGKYINNVGVITECKKENDRYVYIVSNHHIKTTYPLGAFYAFEITYISNEDYLNSIVQYLKH